MGDISLDSKFHALFEGKVGLDSKIHALSKFVGNHDFSMLQVNFDLPRKVPSNINNQNVAKCLFRSFSLI